MRYSCDASPGDAIEITVVEPTTFDPTIVVFLEEAYLPLINFPRSGLSDTYGRVLQAEHPTIKWVVPREGRWFADFLTDFVITAYRRTFDGAVIPMERIR